MVKRFGVFLVSAHATGTPFVTRSFVAATPVGEAEKSEGNVRDYEMARRAFGLPSPGQVRRESSSRRTPPWVGRRGSGFSAQRANRSRADIDENMSHPTKIRQAFFKDSALRDEKHNVPIDERYVYRSVMVRTENGWPVGPSYARDGTYPGRRSPARRLAANLPWAG